MTIRKERTPMYLTYDEYTAYGGDLTAAQFPAAELRARKQIDRLTASRVAAMETVPEEVKLAMMELIKSNAAADVATLAENPLVQSFNNDGYNESYGSASDQLAVVQSSAAAAVADLLYGVADDNGTPLLYRGLDL